MEFAVNVGMYISEMCTNWLNTYYMQVSKLQSLKANMVCGSHPELQRTSSFERAWEENTVENITNNDVVSLVNSTNVSSKGDTNNSMAENPVAAAEMLKSKTKDSKPIKSGRLCHEEKKIGKSHDEKRTRARKLMEFHNIKISQVNIFLYNCIWRCIQQLFQSKSALKIADVVG